MGVLSEHTEVELGVLDHLLDQRTQAEGLVRVI